MNHKKISTTLERMAGKTYSYGNRIHFVKEFNVDVANDKFKIVSNLATYERKLENFEEFIDYWKEIMTPLPVMQDPARSPDISVSLEQEDNLSKSLIAVLNENITKVQENKDYIPQAQCINNNINTIVNIEKMRLSYIKQFKSTKFSA